MNTKLTETKACEEECKSQYITPHGNIQRDGDVHLSLIMPKVCPLSSVLVWLEKANAAQFRGSALSTSGTEMSIGVGEEVQRVRCDVERQVRSQMGDEDVHRGLAAAQVRPETPSVVMP